MAPEVTNLVRQVKCKPKELGPKSAPSATGWSAALPLGVRRHGLGLTTVMATGTSQCAQPCSTQHM